MIASTPQPPYYAVIFTSERTETEEDYENTAIRMFLGLESAREDLGVTVSYWRDQEAIRKWKMNAENKIAQENGRLKWYNNYRTRICLVERDYQFNK